MDTIVHCPQPDVILTAVSIQGNIRRYFGFAQRMLWIDDYYQAMAKIEGEQMRHTPDVAKATALLNALQTQKLTADQRALLARVRDCLLLTNS